MTIPDSITTISEHAFSNCSSLTAVTIPETVTSIGKFAFRLCTSLSAVTIPKSVTNIEEGAFFRCSSLSDIAVDNLNQVYSSVDGNLYSKDLTQLIQYAPGKPDTSFTIPNYVTELIGYGKISGSAEKHANSNHIPFVTMEEPSFFTYRVLDDGTAEITGYTGTGSDITIPSSIDHHFVTGIGEGAFANCSTLTSVRLLDLVTEIGSNAFNGCGGNGAGFAICGSINSAAEAYANENAVQFIALCPVCGSTHTEYTPAKMPSYTETGSTRSMICQDCHFTLEPTVIPCKPIDFTVGSLDGNDRVTVDDATLLQGVLAELNDIDLSDEKIFLQADTNHDGYINIDDVTEIQRYVAELIDGF